MQVVNTAQHAPITSDSPIPPMADLRYRLQPSGLIVEIPLRSGCNPRRMFWSAACVQQILQACSQCTSCYLTLSKLTTWYRSTLHLIAPKRVTCDAVHVTKPYILLLACAFMLAAINPDVHSKTVAAARGHKDATSCASSLLLPTASCNLCVIRVVMRL